MRRLLRPDAPSALEEDVAKRSLDRYFALLQNKRPAKFMIAKRLPAQFSPNDSIEKLWQNHVQLNGEFYRIESEIDAGRLELEDIITSEKSFLDL
jgi:putative pyruvate formate lyase activating enzyme